MKREIGSNFWEYDLNAFSKKSVFWWNDEKYNVSYFKSGRNAIKALCRLLELSNKTILLPSYTCSTVIDPFCEEGCVVDFYKVNLDLSIDQNFLLNAASQRKPKAILFHSYFGADTYRKELGLIEELKEQNIIIIEDLTQSLLSAHKIDCADYYVSSMRKFFAIPDGGFIATRHELPEINKENVNLNISEIALNAFDLKKEYIFNGSLETKRLFRQKYEILNSLISENNLIEDISPVSMNIFYNTDFSSIRKIRRMNYQHLDNKFKNFNKIKKFLYFENENEIPLYYPVYIEGKRKEYQNYMAKNNVYCPIIWPKNSIIKDTDKDINYMYDNMLCIPIDQRYDEEEMNYICNITEIFEEDYMKQ